MMTRGGGDEADGERHGTPAAVAPDDYHESGGGYGHARDGGVTPFLQL